MTAPDPGNLDGYLLRELEGDLASERSADRSVAIQVLARLGRGLAVLDRLKVILDTDPDPALQLAARQAFQALQQSTRPQLREDLAIETAGQPGTLDLESLERALASESPNRRLEATLRVIELQDRRALPLLLDRLDRESDRWVLATLVKGIGGMGAAVHLPRVQRFLNVPDDPRLVANTIEAICALDPDVGFTLITPLLQSGDSRVQANAVFALYHHEKQAALQTLGRMTSSTQKSVRLAAIHCLIRLGDEDCQRLLVRVLIVEEDADIQCRIFDYLEKSGQPAIVEELRQIRGRGFYDPGRLEGLVTTLMQRHAIPPPPRTTTRSRALPAIAGDPSAAPPAAPRIVTPRRTAKTQRTAGAGKQPPARSLLERLTQDWRLSGTCVLLIGLLVSWRLMNHDASLDPATMPVKATTPAELAVSKSPNQHLEQMVRWEGEVEKVDPLNRTVRFRQQGQIISATLPGPLPKEIRQGTQVEVTGRIMGRGRLGSIYLLAQAIQSR